jgi:hypothetical protein
MGNEVSMIVSWLRHIKKCQVTQLNWNVPLDSWQLLNEDIIDEIIISIKQIFSERYQYNLLKNITNHLQLLHQGEIDVLGIEINSGTVTNIYGINVPFNKNCLSLNNNTLMIEKTLTNMIRDAMLIYGYYNLSKGTIIFTTPKINLSVHEQLRKSVTVLNEIFKVYGFQFNFILYDNQDFKQNILNPISNLVEPVSDTTKWILEPVIMNNSSITPRTEQYLRRVTVSNDQVKIGLLVRTEIEKLARNDQISNEMIQALLDHKYSKDTFDIKYPLFKKINKAQSLYEQRIVHGYGRYWSKIFIINGCEYLICNDWYEKNRTKFLKWVDLINLNLKSW